MIDAMRGTPLYQLALVPLRRFELMQWRRRGRMGPTPHLWKQQVLAAYADHYALHALVETGTYMGEMAAAMLTVFDEIYTIELSDELFARAARRFAGEERVRVLHGDSAVVLRELVPKITMPSLFWLDAHYSAGVTARGETESPVLAEILTILSDAGVGHVILVDDAELFVGTGGYPSLSEVEDMVAGLRPSWVVKVRENVIRIHG
jgi:hypothetical protein